MVLPLGLIFCLFHASGLGPTLPTIVVSYLGSRGGCLLTPDSFDLASLLSNCFCFDVFVDTSS